MLNPAPYFFGPTASAGVPVQLIIEPVHAGMVVAVLLLLSCALLWFLTRPAPGQPATAPAPHSPWPRRRLPRSGGAPGPSRPHTSVLVPRPSRS